VRLSSPTAKLVATANPVSRVGHRATLLSCNCLVVCPLRTNADPCEYNNLAFEHPEIVSALLKKLAVFQVCCAYASMYGLYAYYIDTRAPNPKCYATVWQWAKVRQVFPLHTSLTRTTYHLPPCHCRQPPCHLSQKKMVAASLSRLTSQGSICQRGSRVMHPQSLLQPSRKNKRD
jgi:hypothetical protein